MTEIDRPCHAEMPPGCPDEVFVPAVLQPNRIEQFQQQFCAEFVPIGPTEMMLVNELARHAAGAERWDAGSGAVERQAIRNLPEFMATAAAMKMVVADVALAGAMANDSAVQCERFSLLRSRAILRTLQKLEAVQAGRRERERHGAIMPPLSFADEACCERYLVDRLRHGLIGCPKCSENGGCMISTRKCWECAACKTQFGLRARTVMARSPIPLLLWFDAIRILLWRPTICATELAATIGIARIATVRSMAIKIRWAMAANNASERLAGLDRHFARDSST